MKDTEINYEEYLKYKTRKNDRFFFFAFIIFLMFLSAAFFFNNILVLSIFSFLLMLLIIAIETLNSKKKKRNLLNYEENLRYKDFQRIVNLEIYSLIKLMNKIEIDKESIFYISNKFTSSFEACEDYDELEKLYKKIVNERKKYKNYSKNFIMENNLDMNSEINLSLKALGLPLGTTDWGIIRSSYRRLLKHYHPDMKDGDEQKTKQFNVAYNILEKHYKK